MAIGFVGTRGAFVEVRARAAVLVAATSHDLGIAWPISATARVRDRMAILVEVGDAITAYLQDGRAGNAPHLFVTAKAPFTILRSRPLHFPVEARIVPNGCDH